MALIRNLPCFSALATTSSSLRSTAFASRQFFKYQNQTSNKQLLWLAHCTFLQQRHHSRFHSTSNGSSLSLPARFEHHRRQYFATAPSRAQSATQTLSAPTTLNPTERAIYDKLTAELQPTELMVQDTSGGCGSMYSISIISPAFTGLPVVRQHKLVTKILAAEIASWHGLQLVTKAS